MNFTKEMKVCDIRIEELDEKIQQLENSKHLWEIKRDSLQSQMDHAIDMEVMNDAFRIYGDI